MDILRSLSKCHSGHAYYFPLWLRNDVPPAPTPQSGLFDDEAVDAHRGYEFIRTSSDRANDFGQKGTNKFVPTEAGLGAVRANLSIAARAYLAALNLPDPNQDRDTAALIWYHALAIGYSPAYLAEHADGIRQDWPRIPLPATAQALRDSAALGQQVAALLDSETPVVGVTAGTIRAELKSIAVISRVGGGTLQPAEFALTAGWGHGGKNGVTMPGRGKMETRLLSEQELALTPASEQTQDIYLNNTAYWKNIPPAVWEYTIGGYQVIKKWLSYRELSLLGREMTTAEVREVTAMARRIAALVALQNALDASYQTVQADTFPWQAECVV
jgi:hypothetical protein